VLCARETARAGNKVPFLPEAVVDALVGYELHAAGAGDLVLADVGGGGGGGSGGGHDGGHCYSSACSHENVDDGHGLDLFRAIRNGDEDLLGEGCCRGGSGGEVAVEGRTEGGGGGGGTKEEGSGGGGGAGEEGGEAEHGDEEDRAAGCRHV